MRDSDYKALSPAQREAHDSITDADVDEQLDVARAAREVKRANQARQEQAQKVSAVDESIAAVKVDVATIEDEIASVKEQRVKIAVGVALADLSEEDDRKLHSKLADLERQRDIRQMAITQLVERREQLYGQARRAGEVAADAELALDEARDVARCRLAGIVR